MTDRDHDPKSREPDDAGQPDEAARDESAGDEAAGAGSPPGPTPATWAGRRGGSSEEAGDHAQLPAHDSDAQASSDEADAEVAEPTPDAEDGEPAAGDAEDGPDTDERLSHDTVETDTLALGDREAAREAALAGLRARAAEHTAKHGTESFTAPPPKTATPTDGKAKAEQPPAKKPPVPAAPAVPAEPEADEGAPRRGLWARFTAGSLLIVVAMATATAVSLLFFLNGVLDGFHGLPGVQNELAVANPGDPQTFLILGSDERPEDQAIGARSDTAILLRVASDQITVLSIPRDLKVSIPGHGIDRFNAAYTIGGVKLTVKTVKQLTGITDINHVVNVNFTGFAEAVNAIGCVYVDVDHHYYHSNIGLAPLEQYSEIDIPAGYQRLCGYKALAYVRYRHDDNDLVRSARQQEFLREMRQQVPASTIFSDYNKLKDILQQYVTVDIRKEGDLITLAKLLASASDAPVVQVHFPANLGGPTASYVTYSEPALKAAVAKFEGTTPTPTPDEESSGGSGSPGGGGSGGGSGSGGSSGASPAPPPLVDTSVTHETASQLAATKTKSGKPMVDFPIYYPTKLAPDSTVSAVGDVAGQPVGSDSRAFPIDGPGDEAYRGYKFVVSLFSDGYEAYYGVSGTDWQDPPILDHPDETRELDGQDYLLSWDGPQLRLIGWKTDQGSYWVSNTLLNVLTPGQMFGIAQSMQKFTG